MESLTQTCDDDGITTGPTSARARTFRDLLRALNNESDRFQACVAMRDELLDQQAELEWLFAGIEEVMLLECKSYKEAKHQWSNDRRADADAKQWTRFMGIANSGATQNRACLAPLTKVSGFWGHEKVQHYGWASSGLKYCKVLGTAASRNPDWEEALVKLNQLLLNRIKRGQCLRPSANPLNLIDLEHLKTWSSQDKFEMKDRKGYTLQYQPITATDLPTGHAFDQYGLIVSEQVPVELGPADQMDTQSEIIQSEPLNQSNNERPSIATIATPEIAAPGPASSSMPPTPPPTSPEDQHFSRATSTTRLSTPPATRSPSPDGTLDMEDTSPNSSPPVTSRAGENSATKKSSLRASTRLLSSSGKSYTVSAPRSKKAKSKLRESTSQLQKRVQDYDPKSNRVCTCSDTVPSELLFAIEHNDQTNRVEEMIKYETYQNLLCLKHLKMYVELVIRMLRHQLPWERVNNSPQKRLTSNPGDSDPSTPLKKRRLSLPEVRSDLSRAFREQDDLGVVFIPVLEEGSRERPTLDEMGDARFKEQVLAQLGQKMSQSKSVKTWGHLNNSVMYALVSRASLPVISGSDDDVEAYFLSGEEAEKRLESYGVLHGPIITENQQSFKWDEQKGRPVEQLFRRMGSRKRDVSVQKASLSLRQPSCVSMQLGDVQDVFRKNEVSDDPFNVLDLRNLLPRSILPQFLMGEDCQLLSRVRDTILEGGTAERCTAPIGEWSKWKDDEDWVLLAQGGAQTLTHQDSCGKATWLTVQEGRVGFGWMSRPSKEEMREWSADPNGFTGGRLRYVVLQPRQTIYFEAGTIHFVFRLDQHQTLLVGGHILRWSRIESWMQILLHQLKFPNTTNEDLLPSAPVYVEAVTQLVAELKSLGRLDELGGEEAMDRFLSMKKQFEQELKKVAEEMVGLVEG